MRTATATIDRLAGAEDQRAEILASVGDLSNVEVLHNKVLVAIYIEPRKTAGGIILSDSTIKESIWQGTVGLVLKKGKTAFKDDANTDFHGQDVKPGEWVVFRPGDARRVQIRGVDCRMVEDSLLDMVVADPSVVTHRG
ncbi:co-chaperone GroES family protein [Bradyrhizobium cenepequi]|uniref:co-chaperone GroES family protein n=1 Tax=Bradyrhizobium cenepequi TaxID=2821403 RepID=UPI001CE35C57|nr:co-chaperone GroES family protein [Bradyrhizobium cenepequi]MCA6108110.1 co-chaperone GroES [Bradyrhizobium cenepequi]